MAIGRLPASTAEQAVNMVTKIVRYDQAMPSDAILLVADNDDGYDFQSASAQLKSSLAGLRVEQIDRGQMDDQTARTRVLDAINRGQRAVNYIGHGSVNQWKASLLTSADADSLTNDQRPTLFVMMTCLNGYFVDSGFESLAEALIRAPKGGAVAVWASSGLTGPSGHAELNQEFYRLLLSGDGMTVGEAALKAKAAVSDGDLRRTWILFGDPTMRIR